MTYFLAPQEMAPGDAVRLEGEEALHLASSRRIRLGERVALQAPSGARFWARLEEAGRRPALRVEEAAPVPPLPATRLVVGLALVKAKALELVVQKATELGVAELAFFAARHSPVGLDEVAHPKAAARLARIALEACKQCDRQFPPALTPHASPQALLERWGRPTPQTPALWLDGQGQTLQKLALGQPASLLLLVGPEGGFAPEEALLFGQAGLQPLSLGPLTLRADTAAIAGAALLLCPNG